MTVQRRPNLVANLRALDAHLGNLEPNSSFEKRLQHRLQRAAAKNSSPALVSVGLRKYARRLVVAIAACVVLMLSVSEKERSEQPSAVVIPYAPDASIDRIEKPMGDRLEQVFPRRRAIPPTPLPSSPESPKRAPQELHLDNPLVFPAQPEHESMPEKRFIQRKHLVPAPSFVQTQDGAQDRSDGFGFWSPAQILPIDATTPSGNKLGEWSRGGSNQPKTSTTSPPQSSSSACLPADHWKKQAILDCEENGQILSNIVLLDPCDEGLFRHAEHECAESPADEETCTTDTITNGDICVDPGELKMLAHEQCKLANKILVEFTYVTDDCGWKTRKATYACCPFLPDPQPPGPPPVCQSEVVGDGSTCKDLSTIKEDAYWLCNNLGQTLSDLQPTGNCPNGQASIAKIMCCTK